MAFQRNDLCEFRRKRFVYQFWRHLLILSFLASGSMTLHINRTLYGVYKLLSLGACTVGLTIIIHAGHCCLSRSLASFRQIKPTIVASFQLEGYVWLARDPTRRLAHHCLVDQTTPSTSLDVLHHQHAGGMRYRKSRIFRC